MSKTTKAKWDVQRFHKEVFVSSVHRNGTLPYDKYTLAQAEELASKLEQVIQEIKGDNA